MKSTTTSSIQSITPISLDKVETKVKDKKTKHTKKASTGKSTYKTDGAMVYSVLGSVIGDIVGSSREGYGSNAPTAHKLLTAKSNFTDDTVLLIAVADWLNNREKATLKEVLLKWSNTYPNAGYGSLYKRFMETEKAQVSSGNGAAMRVAPCALAAKSLDEVLLLAEEQCKVSHLTDEAINGAKAVAAAIFIARDGRCKGKRAEEIKADVKAYIEETFGYDLGCSVEELRDKSLELEQQRSIYRNSGESSPTYIRMSNASHSCPMAITAFLLGDSFEEAIRYALAMLGDSDTIACMAGGISAQVYGIPQQLVEETLVYLPREMIDVINEFEGTNYTPTRVAPPIITRWKPCGDIVVYGVGAGESENGGFEVTPSQYNRSPRKGYSIPTIGKSLDEIKEGVSAFIDYAKQNPELRFHVRKVGYDKAGYSIEQIAPLFDAAKDMNNILLPKKMLEILNW